MVPIELGRALNHERRGLLQYRPGYQKCQGLMHFWKFERVGHGALFCLKIIEIRQSLKKCAQMVAVEPPFKAFPAETLRFLVAPEPFHHREAHLFPFEGNPTASAFVDSVDRATGLLQSARTEKPAGDFGRDAWHGPGFLALLRDECINVTLGIGNFLQRQVNGALVPPFGDFVSIEGTASAPANDFTISVCRPFWWRLCQINKSLFQLFETGWP